MNGPECSAARAPRGAGPQASGAGGGSLRAEMNSERCGTGRDEG